MDFGAKKYFLSSRNIMTRYVQLVSKTTVNQFITHYLYQFMYQPTEEFILVAEQNINNQSRYAVFECDYAGKSFHPLAVISSPMTGPCSHPEIFHERYGYEIISSPIVTVQKSARKVYLV